MAEGMAPIPVRWESKSCLIKVSSVQDREVLRGHKCGATKIEAWGYGHGVPEELVLGCG